MKEKEAFDLCQLLLEFKHFIDINFQNKQKMTALMFAAKKNFPSVVKLLLDIGAEFELKNEVNS